MTSQMSQSHPRGILVTSDSSDHRPRSPGRDKRHQSYWFLTGTLLGNVHSIIANYGKTITATFCLTDSRFYSIFPWFSERVYNWILGPDTLIDYLSKTCNLKLVKC